MDKNLLLSVILLYKNKLEIIFNTLIYNIRLKSLFQTRSNLCILYKIVISTLFDIYLDERGEFLDIYYGD